MYICKYEWILSEFLNAVFIIFLLYEGWNYENFPLNRIAHYKKNWIHAWKIIWVSSEPSFAAIPIAIYLLTVWMTHCHIAHVMHSSQLKTSSLYTVFVCISFSFELTVFVILTVLALNPYVYCSVGVFVHTCRYECAVAISTHKFILHRLSIGNQLNGVCNCWR